MGIFVVIAIILNHVVINRMSSFSGYDEQSHHDISVYYWNKYIFHSIVNKNISDEFKIIASSMKNLQDYDLKGASCESTLFDNVVINKKIHYIFFI